MKERDFFDKKKNLKWMWRFFLGCLVLLILSDFFIEKPENHFWEKIPAFFSIYGFVACSFIVLIAKKLRHFLKRDENYYD